MSKNLIICEKPSLARNVCNGLKLNGEKFTKIENYYESSNYIVVAVYGHLFSLFDIDDYYGQKMNWSLEQLPFIPSKFHFKLKDNDGIKNQFELIKKLIHDSNVSCITNCGDSDREGEIIIRTVLEQAGNTKTVYRLWLPEQTEETISQEIKNMKLDEAYDKLANEGYARMYVDWVYGINYTRYATVKSGTLLRLGRVITPIVKVIYNRDKEISEFIPQPYYQLVSKEKTNDIDIKLKVNAKYDTIKDESMTKLLEQLNSNPSIVSNIETKERIINSPGLFSQSDLQNHLSKKYKYSPSKTLKITQSLYEKGHVSYPRTPTNFLSSNEKEKVKKVIDTLKTKVGLDNIISFKESNRIFDDSKIESHSAIIPTSKIPDNNALTPDERNCYNAILNRFCAVFCQDSCRIAETIVTITNSNINFELKGSITLVEGFLQFEGKECLKANKQLPNVKKGDQIESLFKIEKKETVPPKHWTVSTLNNFLKNPFKKNDDQEEDIYINMLKGLEIGTEATRSGIIDNAIKSQYIKLSSSGTYTIDELGRYLVETIDKLNIPLDITSTALISGDLKKIYHGQKTVYEVLEKISDILNNIFDKTIEIQPRIFEKETITFCPICSKEIIENTKAFTCVDKNCRFVIWKDSNFITKIGKKKLTKKMVIDLCNNREIKVKGLTSKAGKKYDCKCELEIGSKYINIKPIFNK